MRSRDGSVRPVKGRPGVWRVTVELEPGPDGKRRRRSRNVRGTEKQAHDIKRRLKAELENWTASEDMTVKDFLDGVWLPRVSENPEIRRETRDGYASHVTTHIIPAIGNVKLPDLSAYHVDHMMARLAKTPTKRQPKGQPEGSVHCLSARSRLHVYRVLHAALSEAVRWRMIPVNPLDAVSPPKVPKSRPRALSVADALRYVDAFEGSPIEPVVLVALGAGLRRSEATGLDWSDFDFERRTVHVERGLHQDGTELWYEPTKTPESEARVPMAAFFSDRLKALRGIGPICPDEGGPMPPDKVSRVYKRTVTDAGLPMIALKNLRHTFGTVALGATGDIRTVQKWMRHTTVTTTEDFYLAPDDAAQSAAAEKVDAVWRAGANGGREPTGAKKKLRNH